MVIVRSDISRDCQVDVILSNDRRLLIEGGNISLEDGELIADALRSGLVETLCIRGALLDFGSVELICSALPASSVRRWDLTNCHVCDLWVAQEYLPNVIQRCRSLQVLRVAGSNLDVEVLRCMARALEQTTDCALVEFDVSNTAVDDDSLMAIITALSRNTAAQQERKQQQQQPQDQGTVSQEGPAAEESCQVDPQPQQEPHHEEPPSESSKVLGKSGSINEKEKKKSGSVRRNVVLRPGRMAEAHDIDPTPTPTILHPQDRTSTLDALLLLREACPSPGLTRRGDSHGEISPISSPLSFSKGSSDIRPVLGSPSPSVASTFDDMADVSSFRRASIRTSGIGPLPGISGYSRASTFDDFGSVPDPISFTRGATTNQSLSSIPSPTDSLSRRATTRTMDQIPATTNLMRRAVSQGRDRSPLARRQRRQEWLEERKTRRRGVNPSAQETLTPSPPPSPTRRPREKTKEDGLPDEPVLFHG